MAHHSGDDSAEARKQIVELFARPLGTGPTGRFPEGKLTPDDDGEIAIAIGQTPQGKIVMDFGKPTVWIGFTKAQALEIAELLRKHAEDAPHA